MLQDIKPHLLDNQFRELKPTADDYFFSFKANKILLTIGEHNAVTLPFFGDLYASPEEVEGLTEYLFSIDNRHFFLIRDLEYLDLKGRTLTYLPINTIYKLKEKWQIFAGITAYHLNGWYCKRIYCGYCGNTLENSIHERARICNECGNIEYPMIAPVVMVAVVHEGKLLLTKYADRDFDLHGLVAGFVEIGETLEEAAQREVKEEVGLEISDLKYFGSQPWGISGSVIVGYFAELKGSETICLDQKELSDAAWFERSEVPHELSDLSITYEMIEAFRNKEY